ncbi:MAG TPA: hypothetical protein VIY49_38785 [Bryobacteraceae bacterium]
MSLIAAVLGLPALLVAARAAYRALRASRLKRPAAFELPAIPDASEIYDDSVPDLDVQMAGRDRDTDDFVQLVKDSSLVFLKGDSGAGKSTFLKLGLGRGLYHSREWLPIYVDSWRSDWRDGPWTTLFDALSLALRTVSDDERKRIAERLSPGAQDAGILFNDSLKLFDVLRHIRPATGRRPVILFDQLDTYIDRFESNLVMPDTNRSLDPDELCRRNEFWAHVRDLCQDPDPVHCVVAASSDSPRIECFQFARFHSRPLPNLSQAAAFELIQRLGRDAVANPENGFDELSQRLAAKLARRGQSVLAIELRVVLAGLASPNTRLTPSQLERAGGTDGLAAEWLSHQIAEAQLDQRGVVALLLQMVDRAQRQTMPVPPPREIRYSGDLYECLRELEQRRVLRVRFRGSSEEEWQLYHGYLAGAVLGLEPSLAKWRIYLERADQEFREASWTRKWARLIPPVKQIALLWNRMRGRVYYGEQAAFARISAARLLVNVVTVAAALGFFTWSFWSANTSNERLLSEYESEAARQEALWKLAAVKPAVKIDFLDKLSSRPATVRLLDDRITAALGLRSDVRNAAQRLLISSQACSARFSENACAALATFVDRPEVSAYAAQQILDRLKRGNGEDVFGTGFALAPLARGSTRDFAGEGARALLDTSKRHLKDNNGLAALVLAPLAGEVHNESAAAVGREILEQLQAEKDDNIATARFELSPAVLMTNALASLGPKTEKDFAGPAAQQIVQRLESEKNNVLAAALGIALASLGQRTQGDLAERGARNILDRLKKENSDHVAAGLGGALAALAKEAHSDFAVEGAKEILGRLRKTQDGGAAADLGSALALLTDQAKGDFAEKGARQILGRLGREKGDLEAAQLAGALALLASGARSDLAAEATPLMLARLNSSLYSGLFANALTSFADHNQIPVLVDFLKWPVRLLNRDRVVEKILKLQDVPLERFGFFGGQGNYTAHFWQFADWARAQEDAQGHLLDIDGPPVGPQHLAERFGSLFPK